MEDRDAGKSPLPRRCPEEGLGLPGLKLPANPICRRPSACWLSRLASSSSSSSSRRHPHLPPASPPLFLPSSAPYAGQYAGHSHTNPFIAPALRCFVPLEPRMLQGPTFMCPSAECLETTSGTRSYSLSEHGQGHAPYLAFEQALLSFAKHLVYNLKGEHVAIPSELQPPKFSPIQSFSYPFGWSDLSVIDFDSILFTHLFHTPFLQ
jgi:hypothetical protein